MVQLKLALNNEVEPYLLLPRTMCREPRLRIKGAAINDAPVRLIGCGFQLNVSRQVESPVADQPESCQDLSIRRGWRRKSACTRLRLHKTAC